MVSKRQKESNKKYNKEKMLSIAFRLNKESDAEMIADMKCATGHCSKYDN